MTFSAFLNDHWLGSVVNHLWQSTLVILLAWLLTLVLKRNQAGTRFCVWMAASLKLLVPFSLFVAAGEYLHSPSNDLIMQSPRLVAAIAKVSQPITQSIDFATSAVSEPVSFAAPVHHDYLPFIIGVAWLSGFLFVLTRWALNWRQIRAALLSASEIALPIDLPVFVTSGLTEPGVFGIFRPVLLLPAKIVNRLSAPQLRSILAHEMCHVRRRDNLTAAVHMVVEAIFWFHPAVWWIGTHLIEERERACDEAVLQLGTDAETYAQSILDVCKFYKESPIACMSGVTGSDLKRRIIRIMTEQTGQRLDPSRKLLLSVVAAIAVAAPFTLGFLHATQVRAQSKPANPAANIAASWQGILHTDRDLRFVFKISTADDGTLRATFYNIDGEPGGIPAISTTLNGSLLKLELPFGTYQGIVSTDRNLIKGAWRQGSNALPLNLTRATTDSAWTIPQPAHMAAMASDANPTFEVATIKPSSPDEHGPRFVIQGRRFSVVYASLSDLVNFAYRLQQRQISGSPDWFTTEK